MRFLSLSLITVVIILLSGTTLAKAQEPAMVAGPNKQSGKYRVSLRLPENGLAPGEEQQIEFRVEDTTRESGPAPVIRAAVVSTVSMPAMPSMARVEEIPHPEGIPGDYGLHPTFAHGGEFLLTLRITPPRDEAFTVEFPLKVGDERVAGETRPRPYQVQLKTSPSRIKAGEPVSLQISVLSNLETRDATGRPSGKRELLKVREFDTIHERQLHLIVVRRDLNFFTHQHPEKGSDGTFDLSRFVFPTSGEYHLFIDTAPKGAGGQVLMTSLKVEGKPDVPPSVPSAPSSKQQVGDITVALKDPAALKPRKTLPFAVTLQDSNGPVLDLQPYLGAMGHMIMIHEDAQTFVHSHPDERDSENGKKGQIVFLVRPPKPGNYRAWVEFKRNDKVQIAEFKLEVSDAQNR
jgi:hypothetical protein